MSCLFRSLSAFVEGLHEDGLRQIICNYLEQNPPLMDDLSLRDILHIDGMDTSEYVRNMRCPSTWGGALEIKSFCEIYQVGVVVHIHQTGRDVVFKPSSMENATSLRAVRIVWTGNHYEPIFQK